MLLLFSDRLPTNAENLASMLEQSLRRLFDTRNDIIAVVDKAFPAIEELRINLDGARLRANAPRPSAISGETMFAFQAERLEFGARRILVEEVPFDLQMQAANLRLHQGRNREGQLGLVLYSADSGKITISVAKADLEKLILAVAKREAETQGVSIEDVKLSLSSAGPRALEGIVQVRARKLFLRGVVSISGRLEVDEKLTAQLSGLTCTGDGAVGSMACNFLRPHLQRLTRRQLNLAALPLGEISLRDIQLAVGERLEMTAQFGRNV